MIMKNQKKRSLKKKKIFSSSDDDSDMDTHLEPFPQMPKKACINKDFVHTSDFVQVNQNSIDTLEVPCSVKESPAVTPEVSRVISLQPRISEDDLDELELKLREVPNYKQEMINYFAKIGGTR
ncbi:unnamed protein product [Callosobruchus maculatus]|uniref:Uncharacterized protein n=1 Tax=Callosobruchus maculatus TaxID=64391 RepID=A0A653D4J6_CALMS|nr:unnamed protein product [Callosobruchus maculatus]